MFRDHALATARSGATSAIIIVVLTATLLTLIHLESPTAHAKAAAPAATGGYGSGTLGPWPDQLCSANDVPRCFAMSRPSAAPSCTAMLSPNRTIPFVRTTCSTWAALEITLVLACQGPSVPDP